MLMSENFPVRPDRISERTPLHTIVWNGSIAQIYDFSELAGQPTNDEVCVYDRSDFSTPIERVQIMMSQEEVDGEVGTAYTAYIQLDKTRDDYNPLLRHFRRSGGNEAAFIPTGKRDQDLIIKPTVFSNVHQISYDRGGNFLVWVDGIKKTIKISNNSKLAGEHDGKEVIREVTPLINSTTDQAIILDGFFKAFMRTIDFASGLTATPSQAHLQRTYAIGKEVKCVRADKSVSGIGRSVLSASQTPHPPGGAPAERGSTLSKDLPEIEIVEPELSLDDIGGLPHVKKMLRDIAISFQHPEVMAKWGANRPQGVLMYGEPGTGKTMLAQALANEIGAEMWRLQSTDIYEKWLGNSESRIKDIFSRARQHEGRLVLFFDEFDSIVGITETPGRGGADNARNAVAGIFKQEMNTLAKDNPNVLVVAATNNLDRIDPALIRSGRFDHKLEIPMPDQEARRQIIAGIAAKAMLRLETEGFKVFGDDLNTTKLAGETDGMSGADISEVFRRLGLARAMQEARTGEGQPPISQDEIEQEIRKFRTVG